ncbi:MAG TPA: tRNA (adenosine(37)-N6)-threonylcarbamoyltransferase complex ATPase subunit type 1 TsaE [Marmoricola sp.]|nr:tRNA (adenosine(37)-N6)-threonylcarbamoyltransferase complex ATPase subunit type 1 TsaE [Marmoricola sp.]
MSLEISLAGPERADEVVHTIHAAFEARPALDPPAPALDETADSVGKALAEHGGLVAELHGRVIGSLLLEPRERLLALRRVGVLPDERHHGVAAALAGHAEDLARERGFDGLVLEARAELPGTVRFWQLMGYVEIDREGPHLAMLKLLPHGRRLPTAEDTRALGERLAGVLGAGDLLILSGDLGAGKTTLAQGLGSALGVRGQITSPTFVIARVHPSVTGGPALVHVDAYRLHGSAELDDLDLDTDLDDAVTVVEWGSGLAEALAADRLELRLERAADDVRTATLTPVGRRWLGVDLRPLLGLA